MDGVPLEPDEQARLLEMSASFVEVKSSALQRVIDLDAKAEDHGLRVQLVALELRAAGAVLKWKARAVDGVMLGDAAIVVRDDLGTEYRAFQSHRSGSGRSWTGEALS